MRRIARLKNIIKPFAFSLGLFVASAPVMAVTVANDARNKPEESPYVILVRHGDAPGRGDPENFNLSDCSTQRNLSDLGRRDALALGNALRVRHIKVTKILASRWCRTHQTAELVGFGPVEDSAAFDNMDLPGRAPPNVEVLTTFV